MCGEGPRADGSGEIVMPKKAASIISRLEQAGYEAYAVGGCVRDSLIGRAPEDWDITTSAAPEQVKALFPRTIDTGIAHGTVTVMLGRDGYEVTTYRIDGSYQDGRHPSSVCFTSELREDLRRRDFTINAMAYHPQRGVIDIFGGMRDLQNGIIRCVGVPQERFGEDALRILRAVRFSAQLGFEIDAATLEAARQLAGTLEKVSQERIQVELNKLLLSPNPDAVRILAETGIARVILPELDRMLQTPQIHPYHMYNVGEHTIAVLRAAPAEKYLRWAALLHDVGKPDTMTVDDGGITHFYGHCEHGAKLARGVLRRLKFDNDTIETVSRLVRWHDYRCPLEKKAIRRAVNRIGEDIFRMELALMRADACGKREEKRGQILTELETVEAIYEQIVQEGECTSLKSLAVNGNDLIVQGIPAGPRLGAILAALLEEVLNDSSRNERGWLLRRAQELYRQEKP